MRKNTFLFILGCISLNACGTKKMYTGPQLPETERVIIKDGKLPGFVEFFAFAGSDQFRIKSVDGNLRPGSYNSVEVKPGPHVIGITYRNNSLNRTISSTGVCYIRFIAVPGKQYKAGGIVEEEAWRAWLEDFDTGTIINLGTFSENSPILLTPQPNVPPLSKQIDQPLRIVFSDELDEIHIFFQVGLINAFKKAFKRISFKEIKDYRKSNYPLLWLDFDFEGKRGSQNNQYLSFKWELIFKKKMIEAAVDRVKIPENLNDLNQLNLMIGEICERIYNSIDDSNFAMMKKQIRKY